MFIITIKGKKIAVLIGKQFQDEEATEPVKFLQNEGAILEYIGLEEERLMGLYGREYIDVEKTFDQANPDEYDALLIPGGRSPANLRKDNRPVEFVKRFANSGRPIAAICHGPQLLETAGLLANRKITSYEKIQKELSENTGASVINEPVVVDKNFITSRKPEDIKLFNQAIRNALE